MQGTCLLLAGRHYGENIATSLIFMVEDSMSTLPSSTLSRIQLKLNTAILSTVRVSVRPFVTGVTSHISHIYKGINAMLIIRDPSTPIYSESKSSWLSF